MRTRRHTCTDAATRHPRGAVNWKIVAAIAGAVVGGGVLLFMLANSGLMGDSRMREAATRRAAIDRETGEVFLNYAVADGTPLPWRNPRTGRDTLYPAERCFWTADGKAKLEPTYVLVEAAIGGTGQTLCPDCGRPVVPHNPMPPTELMVEAAQGR